MARLSLASHTNVTGRAEGALRPNKLGVGRSSLAVIFDMRLGRFPSVVHCVFVVTASY